VFDGFDTEQTLTGWMLRLTLSTRGLVEWDTPGATGSLLPVRRNHWRASRQWHPAGRTMTTTFDTSAFERGTDAILQFLTVEKAEALVQYRGDDAIQARIEELAQKNTEGELTEKERAEYEGYVKANNFVAVLQAKARKLLAQR
jgi:hypothetical protein